MNRSYAGIHSVQTKLIGVTALMLAAVLLVNLYIYSRINAMVQRIDSVFASNVSIGELAASLQALDENVYDYLSTRSTNSLENYYRYSQEYKNLTDFMNGRNTDNAQLMLEKNIRDMSLTYLEKAEEAVQAKRGRNVEHYKTAYEEGHQLYNYINSYIYQLNTIRFGENSSRYQYLLSSINILEVFSVVIIFALFAIALVLFILFIRAMIGPMSSLAAAAERVAEGDLNVEVQVIDSKDEIGIVSATFNQMVASIRAYIDRVREGMAEQARLKERELSMEANLKDAQLKFLQAQINPHFLFNSLNAGAQLAMLEEAEATGDFLEKLADFFRYNVKKTDGDTRLIEEIELVDTYIYILNVRFAGDIHYDRMIEEGTEDEVVPGMILQPLVENAVTHGIREIMGRGEIHLQVVREEEFIRVTVRDNGKGMSAEQIARILAGGTAVSAGEQEEKTIRPGGEEERDKAEALMQETQQGGAEDAPEPSTGIGLRNVINRLRLFYGRDDLLSIHSEGHMLGTEITLFLPTEKQEEETEP